MCVCERDWDRKRERERLSNSVCMRMGAIAMGKMWFHKERRKEATPPLLTFFSLKVKGSKNFRRHYMASGLKIVCFCNNFPQNNQNQCVLNDSWQWFIHARVSASLFANPEACWAPSWAMLTVTVREMDIMQNQQAERLKWNNLMNSLQPVNDR